jgi:iron complex outermembrane receptor protein
MSHVSKKPNSFTWLLAGGSLVILLATTLQNSAQAQAQDQSTAGSGGGMEEITVTARKREEKLLDVPVAITAVSAKAIEAQGITTLQDVASFTPGLTVVTTNGGGNRQDRTAATFVIRGMFPTSSSTTSVFINGAPITTNQIAGVTDIERVEVLKGPQSAYFGRQTFAGAINVVTKEPSKTFDGNIDVTLGSGDLHDTRAMVEGTLIDDILTARATFRDYSRSGSYGNNAVIKASPNETLGDQATRSGTLELVFTPIDNLKIKAFGTMWDDDDGSGSQVSILADQSNCSFNVTTAGVTRTNPYFCGTTPTARLQPALNTQVDQYIKGFLNNTSGKGFYLNSPANYNDHFGLYRDAYHVNGSIDYYVESLGFSITAITAANKSFSSSLFDLDNQDTSGIPINNSDGFRQPYYNWAYVAQARTNDLSQEIRAASDQDQPFRWLVGVNYFYSKVQNSLEGLNNLGVNATPAGWNEAETLGAFVGLNYDIVDNLTLSFEARYQVDQRRAYFISGKQQAKAYYHNFVPRTSLQYKFAPDWMAYATYSEGVNPGAFNTGLQALTPAQLAQVVSATGAGVVVQPEYLKNYEIGVKGRFWDGRATIAADVYYDEWSNQIVGSQTFVGGTSPTDPLKLVSANLNIGKTVLKGIEIDGTLNPIEHVNINAGFAVNDSKIAAYVCLTCAQVSGSSYVNGNELPNVSKYQGNVGIQYTDALTLLDGWDWYARTDYIYKSGTYDLAADFVKTQPINLLNLRAGITNASFRIEAFVTNLNNDNSYVNVIPEYNIASSKETFARSDALTVGLPDLRRYGIQVKYKFGGPVEEAETATAAYTPPPVQAPAVAHSYMVFFDFNKSDLTAQAEKIVDQAAANAGTAKATTLAVTGYTDTVGSDAYNMRLSRRRAESVAAKLEKDGVPASEIAIVAKGKHDLLVPTADGVKEPQNRRVTIVYGGGAAS